MGCEDLVEFAFGFQDLAGRDLDVGGLALGAAERLVDHHPRMGQSGPLAVGPGREQHGAHRGGQPGADGPDVARDELHRVVDPQPCRDGTPRGVDVDLDILLGVDRLEEEQLRLDDIGGIVVDRGSEEDDAVHHQAGENIHRGDIQLALLDNRRRDIGRTDRLEIMQFQRTDPAMLSRVFFKFGHIFSIWFHSIP